MKTYDHLFKKNVSTPYASSTSSVIATRDVHTTSLIADQRLNPKMQAILPGIPSFYIYPLRLIEMKHTIQLEL